MLLNSFTDLLDTTRKSFANDSKIMNLLNVDELKDLSFDVQLESIDPLQISNEHQKNIQLDKIKFTHLSEQSESEAWSEPDRSVSLARIGLHDSSLKSISPGNGSIRRSFMLANANQNDIGKFHTFPKSTILSIRFY